MVLVLYCAVSGPTRELSELPDVVLAAVVIIAAVGVIDPPPPPSGRFFPDLDQKRCVCVCVCVCVWASG